MLETILRNLAAAGQQAGIVDQGGNRTVQRPQALHKVIDQLKRVEVELQTGDILVAGHRAQLRSIILGFLDVTASQ